MSGSGYSNVGGSQVYEAGDQRNVKRSDLEEAAKHSIGSTDAHHPKDAQDQRTIPNRVAAHENVSAKSNSDGPETAASKKDPTLPAKLHGNKPSKGAAIDAELQAEEEEVMKKKGNNVPGKK